MSSRLRNAFINASLAIGSLTIFIALGEIGLRMTGIEKGRVVPPPIYQKSANPEISYELKPNMRKRAFRSMVTTDSHGFRSGEPSNGKPILAVLGDSMTFGYGVEDDQTLTARLQSLLPDFSVINAAVPGYTIIQERATYQTKLSSLDPKLLILVFYWNDLTDFDPAVLSDDGNLYPRGFIPPPNHCAPITEGLMGLIPGKCWLDTHSAVYRVLKKLVIQRTEKRNEAEQVESLANNAGYEYVKEESVQRYAAELKKLTDTLPPTLPRLFVIWPERPLHAALRPRIKQIAEQNGFQVIDLYNTFGNSAETLSWDTVHPSAETLERAAGMVKTELESHRFAQP